MSLLRGKILFRRILAVEMADHFGTFVIKGPPQYASKYLQPERKVDARIFGGWE